MSEIIWRDYNVYISLNTIFLIVFPDVQASVSDDLKSVGYVCDDPK